MSEPLRDHGPIAWHFIMESDCEMHVPNGPLEGCPICLVQDRDRLQRERDQYQRAQGVALRRVEVFAEGLREIANMSGMVNTEQPAVLLARRLLDSDAEPPKGRTSE